MENGKKYNLGLDKQCGGDDSFGLLAGFYGEKEVRITKLAEEGFCFRVSVASEILKLQESLRLCFYNMKQSRHQEIAVTPDAWKVETQTDFFCSYAVAVQKEDYVRRCECCSASMTLYPLKTGGR